MARTGSESGSGRIAVIGLGCWYPGARGPREFWENVVARRRQFRRLPDCRLPLADYHDPDHAAPDKTYGRRAAVLDGFAFDWAGNRIPKATYDSTDVVQWLALEVARMAIADAGFDRETIPRDRTGVILGNTLTGEHTRSNTMRLRWPFVRRALRAAAEGRGLAGPAAEAMIEAAESLYKSAFPPITEDTLAGGLSNTIAGRICNVFDLHGGGYTVDGACSSSMLAVCNAASQLAAGDLDLALAGGVDISLDTFELVGFAKTGALSPDEMRVYDRRANGFIPGEGCGFVALKRLADARADGDRVYAILDGWGISSDGKGGLTAPSAAGQAIAIRRAYERAGIDPGRLDFVEGHGTGTRVGDRVELEALARAIGDPKPGDDEGRTVGMTSLKSILGHTKAAAGIGAFIKATIAVNRRVLPPTAGCDRPGDTFDGAAKRLYPIRFGSIAGPDRTLRAGVSAMGFGGINAHATLESGDAPVEGLAPEVEERALLVSAQDSEVFALGAGSIAELIDRLEPLAAEAEQLSLAELTDLAADLGRSIQDSPSVRAAVVAGDSDELAGRLRALATCLRDDPPAPGETRSGDGGDWTVGHRVEGTRIGFLLPGQGSQQLSMVRTLVERHAWARDLVADADRWLEESGSDPVSSRIFRPIDRASGPETLADWAGELARTEVAQPAIVLASILQAKHLANLGLTPDAVGGHSLGELPAFHLAGAFDAETLLKLAALRGRAMAAPDDRPGAMAVLACPADEAKAIVAEVGGALVVANRNGPRQTVISGDEPAVLEAIGAATARGLAARRLPVSNAFHSPRVADASIRLHDEAALPETLGPLTATLFSSVDGRPVEPGLDLRRHVAGQVVAPVDFVALVERMQSACDLLIEVGPGAVLSKLVDEIVGPGGPPCLPVASRPDVDRDLNRVAARAFAMGIDVRWSALQDGRLVRPYVPASARLFLDNPCERPFAPLLGANGPVPAFAGSLDAALAEAAGVDPASFRSYLDRRQGFLADLVRADIRSLGVSTAMPAPKPLPTPVPAVVATAPIPDPSGPDSADLESLLIDLAARQTGFPRESIGPEVRLLDDLNLDSIKAAELVAGAAKTMGVAGRLDPSTLANASLTEIATAIRSAGDDAAGPIPEVQVTAPAIAPREVAIEPSWVRNFVIEYVAEAI